MKRSFILLCFVTLIIVSCSDKRCFNCAEKAATMSHDETKILLLDQVGCDAPEFNVTDINGQKFTLSALKGKVVVLNFYYPTCKGCVAEIPGLNKLVDEYMGKDVVFLAFSDNHNNDTNDFLKNNEFKYNTIISDEAFSDRYCLVDGYPMNMVLDKKGVLKDVHAGASSEGASENVFSFLKPVIEESLK